MQDEEQGRRAFVRRGALTFLAVMALPSALTACGGAVDCTVGVTPDQLTARTTAHYLDNAHSASRNCGICTFFTAAGEGQCGPCSLNMGAVNPLGNCDRFAERA